MMPDIDGFTMLELLTDDAPGVPVLVITALDDRETRLRGLAAGARDFLTKPVDRTELLIRVRNLVALKQSSDALEAAMAELELANRDLQAFAGSLAHDLQQPIAAIAAFAQSIRRGPPLAARQAAHLERISALAATARQMIKALLDFAGLGQAQVRRETVDLNAVVAEARAALPPGDGPAPQWSIGPLPAVRGDAALLVLAFVNLLSNAVKYSRTQAQPRITVDAVPGAGHTQLVRVRDNGVGFDMAQAGRLFSPFQRLHQQPEFEGTGMGLANVLRIMQKHGGQVLAESAPGAGASFTLVFR